MVIVGGGDGSLSSAVDELVDRDCVFALLPLGTANSFARTLGIPLDLDGAIAHHRHRQAPARRSRRDRRRLLCQQRRDRPVAADRRDRAARLKRWLGRFGYLIWAVWWVYRFRPFDLVVETEDGERHEMEALEVRIANGAFMAASRWSTTAEVDSGEIVVQAVTGRAKHRLIRNWLAVLMKDRRSQAGHGDRFPRPPAAADRPSRRCRSRSTARCWARTPATVEVAECAIEVVVPA